MDRLKSLDQDFSIPRQTLSQLLNLTLRQSDAADADPTDNAIPNIQASIIDKSFFMSIGERK
jgi:hypothetical protein